MKKLWPFTQCKIFLEYLRNHNYPVDWDFICANYELPMSFIREHIKDFNWSKFTYYRLLDEDFIREFKDYINWDALETKKLSENFKREFNLTPERIKEIVFRRNHGIWR